MANSLEYIYQIMDLYSAPLKRITQATDRFKNRINIASRALDKFSLKFQQLPSSMRNFKRTIGSPVFQSQIISLRDHTGDIARNINRMSQASSRFAITSKALRAGIDTPTGLPARAQTMRGITGDKFKDVGSRMTAGITLPILGIGVAAAKTAIDFQDAFTGVRKTVEATPQQLSKMREEFKRLSTQIPVSATELMGIGEAAGQLGIKTENITKFTKTIAMLGATTNMTGEEGAMQLARFANITKMSQDNFDRLGSTIVHLGNNLATSEAEISSMSLRLAAAGNIVKMSEAQIMAMAGTLSSLGINAEAGGTAFSKVMLDMNDAVSKGGKELAIMAKVADKPIKDFSALFKKDASKAILAFIEGLGRLDKEGVNVNAILGKLGMQEVRMRNALLAAAGAGDLFRKSQGLANQAWLENNALIKEASLRFSTWSSKLKMAIGKIALLANEIGKIIVPILIDFIDMLIPIFRWFEKLSPAIKKTVVIVAGLVAAIGPLLVLIGFAIPAITTLVGVIGSITLPIAAIIAAVIAWVAIWGTMIAKSAQLRQALVNLANAFSPLIEIAHKAIMTIGKGLAMAMGESGDNIETFGDSVSIIIDLIAALLHTLFRVTTFVPRLGMTLVDSFSQVREVLSGVINSIIADFMKVFEVAKKLKSGDFSGAWESIKNIGTDTAQNIKAIDWDKVIDPIVSAFEGKSYFGETPVINDLGKQAAMEKATAKQDNKVEVSGQIGVSANKGSKVESAYINLNQGYNVAAFGM